MIWADFEGVLDFFYLFYCCQNLSLVLYVGSSIGINGIRIVSLKNNFNCGTPNHHMCGRSELQQSSIQEGKFAGQKFLLYNFFFRV